MDMQKAITVLGINRTKAGDLSPMVKALSLFGGLMNSAEDNQRLEAAKFVLAHWDAYSTACNAARDAKFNRRRA